MIRKEPKISSVFKSDNADSILPRSWKSGSLKYDELKLLTEGGTAKLYTTLDLNLQRNVAYKTLHEDLRESEIETKRFLREARVTANIQHPGTVPLYELGRDREGQLFFTMKKVDGRDLREILLDLRQEVPEVVDKFPLPRLLDILIQVSQTIAFAHNQGVIHRDLKPANIIVGKLLQFIPFLPIFMFYAIYDFNQNQFVNSFILLTFIIAILTTTRMFSFIGPGYRYLLYASPFFWMLLYENNKDLALILISLEILISLIMASRVMINLDTVGVKENKHDELDKVLKIIDKKKNIILLSPVQLNQAFFSRTNKIKAKYVSIWDNDFNLNALLFFEKYMKHYPHINDSYKDLISIGRRVSSSRFASVIRVCVYW